MPAEDRGPDPITELYRRGRENFTELVEGGGAGLDALFHTAPELGELAVGVVYGHLHQRSGLDPRLREAATLAAIVAAGMVGPPLSVHLKTGLASGLAPGEVLEVLLQTAAFAGFPRAVSAAEQLNRLFDESGLASPPARPPREAVLNFCAAVRAGAPEPLASPEVAALLAGTRELEVRATGPDRVLAECFGAGRSVPDGVLCFRVEGERIVEVVPYHPAG
jgi:4-carboxymuconolactone decarboxylase